MKTIKLIDLANNLKSAYQVACESVCKELELPQVALDIIMFLANNPEYCTAKDIVSLRDIKPNLVSVYVDKLVNKGYLVRESIEGDRRKIKLITTKKVQPVIERGRIVQRNFALAITKGLSKDQQEIMTECFERLSLNAEEIINNGDRKN